MSAEQTNGIIMPSQPERDLARGLGRVAGHVVASWVSDGNMVDETRLSILTAMADGDPAVEQYLPAYPNLSGEWADDLTPLSLSQLVTGEDEPSELVMDELAQEWEDGVSETFEPSCEAALRAGLVD